MIVGNREIDAKYVSLRSAMLDACLRDSFTVRLICRVIAPFQGFGDSTFITILPANVFIFHQTLYRVAVLWPSVRRCHAR